MRTVAAANQKDMLNISFFNRRNNLIGMGQNSPVCKAGCQNVTAVDAAHTVIMLITTELFGMSDNFREVLMTVCISGDVPQSFIAYYLGSIDTILIVWTLRH